MRHRQIIEGAAFDPTTLVEIGAAFDHAWSEIEHHFGQTDVELAIAKGMPRISVAHEVLQ